MDLNTLLAVAQNAVDCGNLPAAIEMYEAALHLSPNNIDVLETYAEVLLHDAGSPDDARRLLMHAVAVSPDVGHVKYVNLAQLSSGHTALGFYQSATSVLQGELAKSRTKRRRNEIEKELANVSCAIAELYLTDLCDEPNAEQFCEDALANAQKLWRENIELHQTRGSLRLSQQRLDEARASLMAAVQLTSACGEEDQPTYESKIELGKLLMQVDPTEAFVFLLRVLQINDENPYVWFLLGDAARLRGRLHDAARILKHSRMMVLENPEALREIDASIMQLVESLGGVDASNAIPHMDASNPLDWLEPEEGGAQSECSDEDNEECWEDV